MGIRNAAKAIIVDGGRILVNQNKNSLGEMNRRLSGRAIYYDLPGGGQNQYETFEEAVKRECLEETGYTVEVDRLAAIYEEISMNGKLRAEYEQYAHKIFFIFICRLPGAPVKAPTEKDMDMIGSEWVDIENIKNLPLYPDRIRDNINLLLASKELLFLGSDRAE